MHRSLTHTQQYEDWNNELLSTLLDFIIVIASNIFTGGWEMYSECLYFEGFPKINVQSFWGAGEQLFRQW